MEEIDAIGLLCPLPVLKLRKRLTRLAPGGEVRLICDDPAAAIDVPHFCAEAGHELLSVDTGEGCAVYLVRKG
ncbi:sulfurtransferase TusA family protein [Roseovarius sp. Pro17]|uniref:sulfurtransferase TusA family protein n=1 Tax=Roseovarius sp. Pro17 TaxID=3108175 RepID=UPI002D798C61|nr:sulfurtransferase TusA family protein [Roseovarius sp. Pro17]